ncbi:MAG: DUF2997 domain-containing protein [Chloroflexi bacterium]|nr:DUF2997 domain-containing protein [Chloroflexota bacterium]
MPEIHFEIDQVTGELKTHVKGVPGKSCLDVQKLVEDLVGQAIETTHTSEFRQSTEVKPQGKVRQK